MAIVRAPNAASSSSSSSQFPYHVFLSFRGEDTRKTFTDHLYTALVNAGLSTFRDVDDIERGENIKSEVKAAITRSRSAIIVFSKDYALSSWCLDELVFILQRRKTTGLIVLPIFYDVDPSNVRYQTKSLSEAFVRNEERFKTETDDRKREYWMNKMAGWRTALTEVANLSGMVLKNEADGYESKFIQKVVSVIDDKLTCNDFYVAPYLVGIDARVENINTWLRNGSADVGIFAICGMGGIGKTTIAKCVFNMNFKRFEYSSFLVNVSEIFEQPDGSIRLQRKLLSDILKGKIEKINNDHDGIIKIKSAASQGRVLIVFDDVNQVRELDAIFQMRDWFCPGSKMIITTRQVSFLKVHEPCEIYVVEEMNLGESLELFNWHAFRDRKPAEGYLKLSNKIITYCRGLPLALQLFGSSLRGQSVDVWRSAVEKLKSIPLHNIIDILRICFDSLQNDHDKCLLLDIACFFSGKSEIYVVAILDACNYSTTVGIKNLMDRCFLTVDMDNKIIMHRLLQDIAKYIIHQESPREPGKRSRLWRYMDSLNALKEDTGTEAIEGLALNIPKHEYSREPCNINNENEASFKTDAFSRMQKLRLLEINYVQLTGSYEVFPKNLSWLCWHGCPLRSLPSQFPLDNLVAIDMKHSNLEQLWMGNKFLGLLKFLNLSHCHHLIKTPDFSKLPALEKLVLKDCVSLVEIDESIGIAKGLLFLNLRDCKSLKKLPNNIGTLKFLKVIIAGCSNLDMSPTYIDWLIPRQSCIVPPKNSALAWASILSLTPIPYLLESDNGYVTYSPYRVARWFSYGQGVARHLSFDHAGLESNFHNFLLKSNYHKWDHLPYPLLSFSSRKGKSTDENWSKWLDTLQEWLSTLFRSGCRHSLGVAVDTLQEWLSTLFKSGWSHMRKTRPPKRSPAFSRAYCVLHKPPRSRRYQRVGRSFMISSRVSKNVKSPTLPIESTSRDASATLTKVEDYAVHVTRSQSKRVCDPSLVKPKKKTLSKYDEATLAIPKVPPINSLPCSPRPNLGVVVQDIAWTPSTIHDVPSREEAPVEEAPPREEEIVRLVPSNMAGGQECSTSYGPSRLLPTSSNSMNLNLIEDSFGNMPTVREGVEEGFEVLNSVPLYTVRVNSPPPFLVDENPEDCLVLSVATNVESLSLSSFSPASIDSVRIVEDNIPDVNPQYQVPVVQTQEVAGFSSVGDITRQRQGVRDSSNEHTSTAKTIVDIETSTPLASGDGNIMIPYIGWEGFRITQQAQLILEQVKTKHPDFLSGFLVKYGPYQVIFLEDLANLLTVISSIKIGDITPPLMDNVVQRMNDMITLGIDLKFLQNRLNDIHESSSLSVFEHALIEDDRAIAELEESVVQVEEQLAHLREDLKTRRKTRAEGAEVIRQLREKLSPLDPQMLISQDLF